jgi:hypothetical protein
MCSIKFFLDFRQKWILFTTSHCRMRVFLIKKCVKFYVNYRDPEQENFEKQCYSMLSNLSTSHRCWKLKSFGIWRHVDWWRCGCLEGSKIYPKDGDTIPSKSSATIYQSTLKPIRCLCIYRSVSYNYNIKKIRTDVMNVCNSICCKFPSVKYVRCSPWHDCPNRKMEQLVKFCGSIGL